VSEQRDWVAWHGDYDQPDSSLARRLAAVQERIKVALDEAPPGPLRAVSLCAGQGRDLIGVLAGHPRREDVTARLVELDERNAAFARSSAAAAGLNKVEVVTGDAARTGRYTGMVPAYLVLIGSASAASSCPGCPRPTSATASVPTGSPPTRLRLIPMPASSASSPLFPDP
jgi:hypothetical protein